MKASAAGTGSTAKHAGSAKTSPAAARKHAPAKQPPVTIRVQGHGHVTVTLKMPAPPKPRGLAAGGEWACCSAEAVGASLRLAGWPVAEEDVLALHTATGGTRDRGVPIAAALRAASVHGLAGIRPLWFGERPLDHLPLPFGQRLDVEDPDLSEVDHGIGDRLVHGLIVGLELPGAHAVTVGSDGCWLSWGGHYDPAEFPAAVVEEAWAVVWS